MTYQFSDSSEFGGLQTYCLLLTIIVKIGGGSLCIYYTILIVNVQRKKDAALSTQKYFQRTTIVVRLPQVVVDFYV